MVFSTLFSVSSAAEIISFVVVLPTLPVIPTTGISKQFRYHAANCCKAATVSFTAITEASFASAKARISSLYPLFSCMNKVLAPFCKAPATYLWPSVFSPIIGTNRASSSHSLESIITFLISWPASPVSSSPPTASTNCSTFTGIIMHFSLPLTFLL